MKTIIAVWNSADRGKSKTLRKFADITISLSPQKIIEEKNYYNSNGDFRLVVELNGKIIAIETAGDPSTELDLRLKEIVDSHNPDIILCTTRTSGATVYGVSAFSTIYDVIWTSTYQYETNTSIEDILNETKAKHLFDLLKTLGRL